MSESLSTKTSWWSGTYGIVIKAAKMRCWYEGGGGLSQSKYWRKQLNIQRCLFIGSIKERQIGVFEATFIRCFISITSLIALTSRNDPGIFIDMAPPYNSLRSNWLLALGAAPSTGLVSGDGDLLVAWGELSLRPLTNDDMLKVPPGLMSIGPVLSTRLPLLLLAIFVRLQQLCGQLQRYTHELIMKDCQTKVEWVS